MTANSLYSNFVDAADDLGSIKQSKENLAYISGLAGGIVRLDLVNELSAGAVYPFIGGTAHSHKFNFMNPVDSDAAKRLVFNGGGWIHDNNGIKPNGTSSIANTFVTLTNSQRLNSTLAVNSFTDYKSANATTNYAIDIGHGNTGDSINNLLLRYTDDLFYYDNRVVGFSSALTSNSIGFYLGTLKDGFMRSYKNGLMLTNINNSLVSNTEITDTITLSGRTHTGSVCFSPRGLSFALIGLGILDVKVQRFSHLIKTLQNIKGRL